MGRSAQADNDQMPMQRKTHAASQPRALPAVVSAPAKAASGPPGLFANARKAPQPRAKPQLFAQARGLPTMFQTVAKRLAAAPSKRRLALIALIPPA